MNDHPQLPPTPTVRDSVSEAIHAGHELLLHRFELAILDARAFAIKAGTRGGLVAMGGVFALFALTAIELALLFALRTAVSTPIAFVICAAINFVVAAVFVAAGILHGRGTNHVLH